MSAPETFTDDERARLAPYFTNLDGHVFALTNLPETVKGALFARYSRSAKSLRRLFLDEFADKISDRTTSAGSEPESVGVARAEKLFDKVFNEYGDDSVAQLGGAHIACEYVSNVLTKLLEWGRLMAYLEQSTRYVPYTDRLNGAWRYHVPAEISDVRLRERYTATMDAAFENGRSSGLITSGSLTTAAARSSASVLPVTVRTLVSRRGASVFSSRSRSAIVPRSVACGSARKSARPSKRKCAPSASVAFSVSGDGYRPAIERTFRMFSPPAMRW